MEYVPYTAAPAPATATAAAAAVAAADGCPLCDGGSGTGGEAAAATVSGGGASDPCAGAADSNTTSEKANSLEAAALPTPALIPHAPFRFAGAFDSPAPAAEVGGVDGEGGKVGEGGEGGAGGEGGEGGEAARGAYRHVRALLEPSFEASVEGGALLRGASCV